MWTNVKMQKGAGVSCVTQEKTRTVLVVDDDREAVIEIADVLASSGIVFAGYIDAKKALDRIERDLTVEGCFVDLLMPGMNGIEFMRRIRGLPGPRGRLPLVAVSGVLEQQLLTSAIDAGAMTVLRKPIKPDSLRDALQAILATTQPCTPPRSEIAAIHASCGGDLTELQNLRLELELARKARTEFLGIVNHELRTPLNGIMGFAGLLENNAKKMKLESIIEYAEQISNCGRMLLGQIERILELSSERSSQPTEQLEAVSVDAIIASACREVSHIAEQRHAEVCQPPSLPECAIVCRMRRIARSLALVVENAVKFGGTPPVVAITSVCQGPDWIVSVSDNGPGMSLEEMKRAFDAFHLGDSSNTRRHGGLGIGLTLARRYIEEHGGNINLSNRPEGGLRVVITLPRNIGTPSFSTL